MRLSHRSRSAVLLSLLGAAAPVSAQVEPARIKEHVRVLSSDLFLGRGPAQPGEEKTVGYLAQQFRAAGLAPAGPGGSWFQNVDLIRYDRVGTPQIQVRIGGVAQPLRVGPQVTASSRIVGETRLENAPLVFVGYGIDDPRLGWNSFGDVDLRGKVAVFLPNDPDFEAEGPGDFGGRALAFVGRFGAKVEAARRKGAAAVLVIHETAAASYPWSQVQNSDPAPGFGLPPSDPQARPFGLTGWLHRDAAVDLFRRAGLDYEALKKAARENTFRARPIGDATLSARLTTKRARVTSRNVVGRIVGKSRPNETIVYGAHWDANGIGLPDRRGDRIRNGAVDNAVGTATLVEIARAFGRGPQPQRSVLFIAYTAEEKGLLGAEHYVANPLYPLETTVAVLNLDPHVALPKARTLDLIGGGRTDLEQDLVRVAQRHGLRVEEERSPEAGWYYRSDHFAFAKKGVPALAFRAGRDLAKGGKAVGEPMIEEYNANRYHQTTDEFDPRWDMVGAAQEGQVAFEIGRQLANNRRWPRWNEGVEYKTVREASAAARR